MAIFNSKLLVKSDALGQRTNEGLLPFGGNVVVQGNPDLNFFHTGRRPIFGGA